MDADGVSHYPTAHVQVFLGLLRDRAFGGRFQYVKRFWIWDMKCFAGSQRVLEPATILRTSSLTDS